MSPAETDPRAAPMGGGALPRVDHLVFAGPDLRDAVDRVERRVGVRPVPGGRHPDWGTRNALLALGRERYLEVIGPDPEAAGAERAPPFGIDRLAAPRLVTWALRVDDPAERAARARERGLELGPVLDGRRERPDGTTLAWRLTDPTAERGDGLVPFLIAWEGDEHPADAIPSAGALVALRAEHPEPERIRALLGALGVIGLSVDRGSGRRLVALLRTGKGPVELS